MKLVSFKACSIIMICLLFASMLFSSCSKALLYQPGTVEEEIQKAVAGDLTGIIVYVNQAGNSASYAAGMNNRAKQIPADPKSLYKIASISKLYLAAAAAKLVANKQLALDQKLSELLPEVVGKIENANEITLEMMIRHRSGIRDYGFEAEVEGENFDDYMSYMARIYNKEAKFKPNKKYGYSNSNYLLLAEIMDRSLGYSHQEFIQKEILDKLGLVNTFHSLHETDTSQVMSGYLLNWEPDIKAWDFPLPGGNMIASAEDVGIFLNALANGILLNQKEQTIYAAIYKYEHTGWLPGYTSIASYHPKLNAVVVQFINTSGKEFLWLKLKRINGRIVKAVKKASK